MNVPALAYPRHLQTVDDVFCSQYLGINDIVDSHFVEQFLVLLFDVCRAVHTCHRFFRPQLMRHDAGGYVDRLVRCDGDEKVGVFRTGLFQSTDVGCRAFHGQQVELAADLFKVLWIFIQQDDVLLVA